tara:strand:+ start:11497 stop:12705 length:1209 start_codon:yes stop_codon:yes gene_type:complete
MQSSSFVFVGDVHIGNHKRHGGRYVAGVNERCRLTLSALRNVYKETAKRRPQAKYVVILGDLFDNPNVSPTMLYYTQDIIQYGKELELETIIIQGNHDQASDHEDHNALGPLTHLATIINKPTVITEGEEQLFAIPFQSGKCTTWLTKHVRALSETGSQAWVSSRLLAFHAGVVDDSTPGFLRNSDTAITKDKLLDLCNDCDISAAFAGHWHNAKSWQGYYHEDDRHINIIQAGALVPTGWGNEGFNYGAIYEHVEAERRVGIISMVPGPRFVTITPKDDIGSLKGAKKKNLIGETDLDNVIFARIKASETEIELANELLNAAMTADVIHSGEVLYASKTSEDTARQTAEKTKSSETLEEAIVNYTDTIQLDVYMDKEFQPEARERIRNLVARFLGESGDEH